MADSSVSLATLLRKRDAQKPLRWDMLKCTICFQKCATRSLERGDSLACVWKGFWEKVEASRIIHSNHIARTVPTRSICHSFSMGGQLPFDLPEISCNILDWFVNSTAVDQDRNASPETICGAQYRGDHRIDQRVRLVMGTHEGECCWGLNARTAIAWTYRTLAECSAVPPARRSELACSTAVDECVQWAWCWAETRVLCNSSRTETKPLHSRCGAIFILPEIASIDRLGFSIHRQPQKKTRQAATD